MNIDGDYLRDTLVRLVQINSINPTLAPGAPGEAEIAAFIAGSLRSGGLPTRTVNQSRAAPACSGVWLEPAAGAVSCSTPTLTR